MQQVTYYVWLVYPNVTLPLYHQCYQQQSLSITTLESPDSKLLLLWLLCCTMIIITLSSLFIFIVLIISTMTTVTPKHSGITKDWKYIKTINLTTIHTQHKPTFKSQFNLNSFAIHHAILKGLYEDYTTVTTLHVTAINKLKDMIVTTIVTDLNITDNKTMNHISSLFDSDVTLFYHDKRNQKLQNPTDLGKLFDSAQNVSDCVEVLINITTLWSDKTNKYFDIYNRNRSPEMNQPTVCTVLEQIQIQTTKTTPLVVISRRSVILFSPIPKPEVKL